MAPRGSRYDLPMPDPKARRLNATIALAN